MMLPTKKYNIIYADPPWKFRNKKTGGSLSSGSASKYDVMSLADIFYFNVQELAADDCFLFMWWVASMPQEAIDTVTHWGFTLKTMTAFSWIKKTKTGKDHFGMGFYTRQQQEHCLVATRGKPKVVSRSVRQNIREENIKHSQKPLKARDAIVELCGDVPRLELFARQRTPGWDAWGNELWTPDINPEKEIEDKAMPLYTYECECGCEEEHLVKLAERKDTKYFCPECGLIMNRKVDAPNLGQAAHQMAAVMGNGEVIPGHFGKTAKRSR